MNSDPDTKKTKDLMIKNVRIIDGMGSVHENLSTILIHNGIIEKIGNDDHKGNFHELDVSGATVMPGLMDAHVHLQSVPGSVFRRDSEETLKKLRYHHLRSYVACGVTTILDNAISATMLKEFQDFLKEGGTGPNLYALAPTFYPPGGYLDNNLLTDYWGPHWKSAGSKEDIESLFREYEGIPNIVGTKTVLERGFKPHAPWPIHSPEIRRIITEESKKRNLPVHIHALKVKEQKIALEMGVRTLAHSGFLTGSPTVEFLNELKQKGIYVTTTLASVIEQTLVRYHPERLEDELLKLTIPEEELKTASDLQAWDDMYNTTFRGILPKWTPSFIIKMMIQSVNVEKLIHNQLKHATGALLKMHGEGIPIVIGTDSANWPIFLNFFHGSSTIREIEIMGEAGMLPMDVIMAATRVPAEMMGIDHLLGTVEEGKRADLIVVREDPLKNLSALRKLMWIIKDGEARTPVDWMKE